MTDLKPWVSNPDPTSPFPVTFPQASVTHPERGVALGSPTPGRYDNTVATKSPGAGELKEFAGGTAPRISRVTNTPATQQVSHKNPPGPIPAQPGRRGKGTPITTQRSRTIVP
jgi:hypothetical protein